MPNPRAIAASVTNAAFSLSLFLEREAGHAVLSLALIWIGLQLCEPVARAQAAHDLVVFGLGVLSRSMGATRAPGSTTTVTGTGTTTTETQP